jgi:hypothetical protein
MGFFYAGLSSGLPRDRALQQAQQRIREQHPDASPYLWAAPILSGEVSALHLPPSRTRHYALAALLLAGLILCITFYRRRARSRTF